MQFCVKNFLAFGLFIFFTVGVMFRCDPPKKKQFDGADVLKFQGSWFLRIYELDFTDSIKPGQKILVQGNEVYKDFTAKIMELLRQGKLTAYKNSGEPMSLNQVYLGLVSESLRTLIDTTKPIDESNLFNIQLLGIELNDSIYLDIKRETKQYKMHSINLFIPAEFNGEGGNQNVCRIYYADLKGKGLDEELRALEERRFARKEKIYHPDGTVTDEYTFYLTDAAGVQYYFTTPLEELLAEGNLIRNSILSYFIDDIIDRDE